VDPATIVKSLAKQGLITEGYVRPSIPSFASYKITDDDKSQLTEELLKDLKEPINASNNLKIIPTSVYEAKLAALEASLENDDDDEEEEEEEEEED